MNMTETDASNRHSHIRPDYAELSTQAELPSIHFFPPSVHDSTSLRHGFGARRRGPCRAVLLKTMLDEIGIFTLVGQGIKPN